MRTLMCEGAMWSMRRVLVPLRSFFLGGLLCGGGELEVEDDFDSSSEEEEEEGEPFPRTSSRSISSAILKFFSAESKKEEENRVN